jgi:hypothetical protein
MSKKRAGYQAGVNLASLASVSAFETVEEHYADVIGAIPKLRALEDAMQAMAAKSASIDALSKAELDQIISWKHTVGANRVYNVKHIKANKEEAVETHSRAGIAMARNIDLAACLDAGADGGSLNPAGRKTIQGAIAELGKLQGVGPATASAILTLVRPDVFCYMYDEVIDCFEPQRDYRITQYVRVNSCCLKLASELGPGWTTSRVARAIWTAAKFSASFGQDLTERAAKDPDTRKSEKRAAIETKPAAEPLSSSISGSSSSKKKKRS